MIEGFVRALLRVLILVVLAAGTTDPASTQTRDEELYKAAELLLTKGEFNTAAPLAEQVVREREKRYGPESIKTGVALNMLGAIELERGRYREAEGLLGRSAQILEKTSGEDADLANVLGNLGRAKQKLSQFQAAEALFKRALAIYAAAVIDPSLVGHGFTNLGGLYRQQGRYAEAEEAHLNAAEAYRLAERGGHGDQRFPWVPMSLNNLAVVYMDQGKFGDAEPLLKQSLKSLEERFGADNPSVVRTLAGLGELYREQGRLADAERELKRALQITERQNNSIEIATALNNLATHYFVAGRPLEAERLYQRALTTLENALGDVDHPSLGGVLSNFSRLLMDQRRYEEAILLYPRILRTIMGTVGTEHLYFATALNTLGQALRLAGNDVEAEKQFRHAQSIATKVLGKQSPAAAEYMHNVALTLQDQNRYGDAEPLYRQAIVIWKKAHGPNHTLVATGLSGLASVLVAQGRYGEAKPLYDEALRIRQAIFGPDHPLVGDSLYLLAEWHSKQGRWSEAVPLLRRATDIIVREETRGSESEGATGRPRDLTRHSQQFVALLKVAYSLSSEGKERNQLAREMFERAQWMQASKAARSLAQMAVRGASGTPVVAELVRERQGLAAEWQQRDTSRNVALAKAAGERNGQVEAHNLGRLAAIDVRIREIDQRLATEFPAYAALARLAPLTVDEVQAQLAGDEVLVQFVDTAEETFVWAVTNTDVRWVRLEVNGAALKRDVMALRCGLDAALWYVEASDRACQELTKGAPKRDQLGSIFYETLPFRTERAHGLYNALFGQIQDIMHQKKHLLVVLSGSLTQLPLHVLVSEPPAISDFHSARWLVRTHAVTVLPSVASLKALRLVARPSAASQRMIGFGNPLLQGDPKNPQEVKWAAQALEAKACKGLPNLTVAGAAQTRRNIRQVPIRSGYASLGHLKSQVPLPDTAVELCKIATALRLAQDDIFLGARATETTVKRLSTEGRLANYRVVHFATHGGVAGEIKGTSEPGLILTPPDKQTDLDDGYLTASEVSALKLDADWVILSACNTAAGEDGAAEALSGLARAFFFAGARALLASHWAVESPTTVKLITSALANLVEDPKAGRAEVLRRAMLGMIDNGEAREAHPAFWAPFVVVGEGGAGR